MNKQRRKNIALLLEELALAREMIEDLKSEADCIRDEEQEAYDNMPEVFQETERGEAMEEAIEMLEEICRALEEAQESIEEAIDGLEELA